MLLNDSQNNLWEVSFLQFLFSLGSLCQSVVQIPLLILPVVFWSPAINSSISHTHPYTKEKPSVLVQIHTKEVRWESSYMNFILPTYSAQLDGDMPHFCYAKQLQFPLSQFLPGDYAQDSH